MQALNQSNGSWNFEDRSRKKARDLPDLQNSFQLLLCRNNLEETIESRFLCLQQDTMTFSSPPQAFPSTSLIRPGHKQTNNKLEIEDSNLNNCERSSRYIWWGGGRGRGPGFLCFLFLCEDRQTDRLVFQLLHVRTVFTFTSRHRQVYSLPSLTSINTC